MDSPLSLRLSPSQSDVDVDLQRLSVHFPALCGSLRWMCCPLEMNYTTSSDALPWSSPRIVLPRRRSTHITDRWWEQCPPLTKVNCYSPAQHLVGALVCPPLTHCVHAHAHMYTCEWAHVNMREVKLRPRGAHSTPREHFRETLRRIVT